MRKIDGKEPDITDIADMDKDAWNAYKNIFPRKNITMYQILLMSI